MTSRKFAWFKPALVGSVTLAILLVASLAPTAIGQITVDFSGAVAPFGPATAFGKSVDSGAPLAGQLWIDQTAELTHDESPSYKGYRHLVEGGIQLVFGTGESSVSVVANEYVVFIWNDAYDPLEEADYDLISFWFDMQYSMSQPLLVDGQPRVTTDYNHDGVVDHLDYQKWRSDYGKVGATRADGNQDGVVDAADYVVWRDGGGEPIGSLLINFKSFNDPFDSAVLADADLLADFTPQMFGSIFNFLTDSPPTPNVLFDLHTWTTSEVLGATQPVPEPLALSLVLALMALHASPRGRRR